MPVLVHFCPVAVVIPSLLKILAISLIPLPERAKLKTRWIIGFNEDSGTSVLLTLCSLTVTIVK